MSNKYEEALKTANILAHDIIPAEKQDIAQTLSGILATIGGNIH